MPSIDTLNALKETWIWHNITIASGNHEALTNVVVDASLDIAEVWCTTLR
jgi:hypothetical protein